jgi:ubiquinol oxidase
VISTDELKAEQEKTLSTPKLKPGIPAKLLFALMDSVYGKKATMSKFLVLEIVARMPYVAWEQVSYVAITHKHSDPLFAKDIHENVVESRSQQDNEMWHLLILEELIQKRNTRLGFFKVRVLPQVLAYIYYHVSWLMYVMKPRFSYQLNAEFEDHAEHEYMKFVLDHPEFEDEKWESKLKDDYGDFDTLADLFRNIGLDEREHKELSLEKIENARFAPKSGS